MFQVSFSFPPFNKRELSRPYCAVLDYSDDMLNPAAKPVTDWKKSETAADGGEVFKFAAIAGDVIMKGQKRKDGIANPPTYLFVGGDGTIIGCGSDRKYARANQLQFFRSKRQ